MTDHTDWRPADEAPENVAVLIHIPGADYYGNDGVYAAMLVNMGTGRRWMTFGWSVGRDCAIDAQPTSWRPLPTPPSSCVRDRA